MFAVDKNRIPDALHNLQPKIAVGSYVERAQDPRIDNDERRVRMGERSKGSHLVIGAWVTVGLS